MAADVLGIIERLLFGEDDDAKVARCALADMFDEAGEYETASRLRDELVKLHRVIHTQIAFAPNDPEKITDDDLVSNFIETHWVGTELEARALCRADDEHSPGRWVRTLAEAKEIMQLELLSIQALDDEESLALDGGPLSGSEVYDDDDEGIDLGDLDHDGSADELDDDYEAYRQDISED